MEWKIVPISSICEGIYEGPHATPPSCDSGAYYLGIPALSDDGQIDFSKVPYVSEEYYLKWTKRVTPKYGDIVFTNEATLNLYARIPKDFYGCLGRRLGLVRPLQNKVDVNYLFYYFFSPYWRNIIARKKVSGSTVERILMKKFPNFPVILPPIATQQKIASILSAYDTQIENNQKRIKLLEQMAENLYKEWFVRFRFPGYENAEFEGGIPKGWEIEKLGNVANICTGKCNREDAEEDGIYPLFDRSQEIKKSNTWIMDCEAIIVPGEGTSFIPRYYEGKFNLHQRCYCVEPKQKGTGKFLFYMLMFNRAYFLSVATGATVPSLRLNNFTKMKFIMPSLELCKLYDRQITLFFREISYLSKQIETLTTQRDLLLPRLMSGKLSI